MNNVLARALSEVRALLESDPDGIVAGELPAGNLQALKQALPPWQTYYEFLAQCDGGRFGSVDLWSLGGLSENNHRTADFPGSPEEWLCFGQLLYDPLGMRRTSGEVFLLRAGGGDMSLSPLGEFDAFLETTLLGPGYAGAVPDADQEEWFLFLRRIGRA